MNYQKKLFNGPRDWAWITQRSPLRRCEDTCGFIALDGEQHVGAIIFDSFTHKTVNVHLVIDNPMILRHGFLEDAMHFAFVTAGLDRAYAHVMDDNEKALRFCRHFGWKESHRLKGTHESGDTIVMVLEKPVKIGLRLVA